MPAKPAWFAHLARVVEELNSLPQPWVDRLTLERLLSVGPRRAQQILQPCVSLRLGANGLADRQVVIDHLGQLASGEAAYYEQRRQARVLKMLEGWRRQWLEQPRLLVEARDSVVNQEFEDLPEGVRLAPGRVTVEFKAPQEALEKLLALAMAIGNDFSRFEKLTTASVKKAIQ
jgi:hypothetical protein